MVPCKRHNRSLQSPRGTLHNLPSDFKAGHPLPFSRESFTPPSPFCGFRFVREARSSLIHNRISVLWPSAPNGKRERRKIQTLRPHRANSQRILALTTSFGVMSSKWCGTERS
ncbi:hypothetical protein AVEN_48386-1 [Araneus ventricosus]|uniref:Uncharacterized protein n=1 Tax=Araneus ventricosus TaxID=182803 RepID=A0A4Y2IFH4_ARAVE|nr:hypothetical protein AVEN_48386-1 [Araneus ventricosus]